MSVIVTEVTMRLKTGQSKLFFVLFFHLLETESH
jgi:hypothetical protein